MLSPEKFSSLENDISLRMKELLFDVLSEPADMDTDTLLRYLRAAYGKGYSDALLDKGALIKQHY